MIASSENAMALLEEKNLNPLFSAQLIGLNNYFKELVEMEKKSTFLMLIQMFSTFHRSHEELYQLCTKPLQMPEKRLR